MSTKNERLVARVSQLPLAETHKPLTVGRIFDTFFIFKTILITVTLSWRRSVCTFHGQSGKRVENVAVLIGGCHCRELSRHGGRWSSVIATAYQYDILDDRSSIDDVIERNDGGDYSLVAVRSCHRMAAALRSKNPSLLLCGFYGNDTQKQQQLCWL